MTTLTLIKDNLSGNYFGAVVSDGFKTDAIGFSKAGNAWAKWTSELSTKTADVSLDYSLTKEKSFEVTAKSLSGLREEVSDVAFWKIKKSLPETALIQYGPRHKTMGTRYVSKRVIEKSSLISGTMARPISFFDESQRAAVLSYKAQFAVTNQKYSTLELQVKRNRAIFDGNIGPGGGWRCPDGTLYGGQITDRFGRGCGGGLTRRIGRAMMRAGQRLDDVGGSRDSRRLERRARSDQRRTERRTRMANAFDAAGDKFDQWAEALVGDYMPPTGGRRRRRGLDPDKVTRDAKKGKKRVLSPDVEAAKEKKKRTKKGVRARLADFGDRISDASERMARRLVGDYQPPKKERKKKGSKREAAAEKLDRLADALDRAARRILGGGRRQRRQRDEKPVERKPAPKKPSAKKPTPKKPAPKKPGDEKPGFKPYMPGQDSGQKTDTSDIPSMTNEELDKVIEAAKGPFPLDGNVTRGRILRERAEAAEKEKRRRAKGGKPQPKPQQVVPEAPTKTPASNKQDRIKEIDTELNDIYNKIAQVEFAISMNDDYGVSNETNMKELRKLEKRRTELLAEKIQLTSNDPVTPAKLPKNKPSGKPSGTAKKTFAGKQYGGVYSKPENAKKKAHEQSIAEGKPLFVVQDANGKYRVVDEERLKSDDSLQVVFATDHDGGIIEIPDVEAPVDEIIEEVLDADEKVTQDALEHLKDLDVDNLDLELKRSKTGAFMPENFDKQVLDAYTSAADANFRKAFHEERMKNFRFWQNTLGEDKFEGVDDSKTFLAIIDKAIKDESNEPDSNDAILGVMRAERANFLAMWVPDEGKDEVNFYERFNFVMPKRRSQIIANADLGDLIVGAKKKNAKEKPQKVSPEAPFNPNADKVPSPDDMTPSSVPDVPEKKKFYDKTEASKYEKDSFAEVWNEEKKLEARKAIEDNNFDGYRDPETGMLDNDSVKNVYKEIFQASDKFENLKKEEYDFDEGVDQDRIDERNKARAEVERLVLLRDMILEEAKKENSIKEKQDNTTVDTEAVTPDGVPDGPSKQDLVNEKADLWEQEELNKTQFSNEINDQYLNDFGVNQKDNDNGFNSDDDIDQTFNQIEENFDLDVQFAKDRIEKAKNGEYEYPDTPGEVGNSLDADLKLVSSELAVKSLLAERRSKLKEKLAAKVDNDGEVPKFNKSEALKRFLDVAQANGFDVDKIEANLASKFGSDSLTGFANQVAAKFELGDWLESLPENFEDMQPDQQLELLRTISGASDNVKAAGRWYRHLFFKKYGNADSINSLANATNAIKELKSGFVSVTTQDAQSSVVSAAADLAKLHDEVSKLDNPSFFERLRLNGQMQTARNNYIAALAVKFNHFGFSNEDRASAYTQMIENINASPEQLQKLMRAQLVPDMTIDSGNPGLKSAKNMPASPNFAPDVLASTQPDGSAIAQHIPIGTGGVFSQNVASSEVANGRQLSSIPDDFLAEAIKQNIGDDKRFRMLKINKGFNSDTTAVLDTISGKKYIIKTEDRNHLGHIQESAASKLAQDLGFTVAGVRYGSSLKDVDLPAARKSAEGVTTGLGRTMVIEHLENIFPGDGVNPSVVSYDSLPANAEIDGESVARLMVLDRAMNYFDRTSGNLFFVRKPDGKWAAQPIDHGNAFRPWEGSKNENTVGFVQITKGDNVSLIDLVRNLPDDEKQAFAKGLLDANKRLQKVDHANSFDQIGSSFPASPFESARLKQHGDWLNQRKADLDWDEMTKVALGEVGFSGDDIEKMTSVPPQYSLPQSSFTVASLDKAIESVRGQSSKPFVRMVHDGDQIEYNEVRVADVNVVGLDGMKIGKNKTRTTQFTFRRRNDAQKIPVTEAKGWTKLDSGHVVPNRNSNTGEINFDFSGPHAKAPSQTDSNKATWYKELDDGTIVMVTKSSDKKNTADQMVRVFVPDSNGKPASQEQFAKALKAAGVNDVDPPSAEKLRANAEANIFTTLTGKKLSGEADREQALEQALGKWGLTKDDIRLNAHEDGGIDVGFTPDAAKKLADQITQKTGVKNVFHRHYSGSPDTFVSGSLLSTLQRFDHGILKTGSSSYKDMDTHGSGNWLYFYKAKNESDYNGYGVVSVMPLDIAFIRGDFRAFNDDAWGDIDKYQDIETGFGQLYGNNEVDFRSGVSFGTMLTLVPDEATRNQFVQAALDAGVTQIDGVSVQDLIKVHGDNVGIQQSLSIIRTKLGLE
jgi:hypothetical protein